MTQTQIDVAERTSGIVARLEDALERGSWVDDDGREVYDARMVAQALRLDYGPSLTSWLPAEWKVMRFIYGRGFRDVRRLYITREGVKLWATCALGVRHSEVRKTLDKRLATEQTR